MGLKELQDKWNATPDKGILPLSTKTRMWESIEAATIAKRRRKTYQWLAAACMLLLLSVSTYYFLNTPQANANIVVTHTYPGDIRLLRLPDGSRVWVNQNTIIEYPEVFEGNTRNVTLTGEAFFEVARDESKPFIITSGNITTTVLGTSFSVASYKNNSAMVSVHSGKVKVEGKQNKVFLVKGNAAIYRPATNMLQKNTVPVCEPNWKKSLIDIDGLTLQQVIAQLNKVKAFNVEYANDGLKELKIKGILDSRQGFEAMLQTIAFALEVKIEPHGPTTYRISR
ncbi:iron dicitrate transport regulator FecR [Flavobacterium zepuense]|uniref:Iron dicitrate transport regulator FecR n=1 Tax=Flavobacterium zepuense TaxID=2593302 RepID=A0A552V9U7_9FLAO|nr:FecR domain-containing protein [Flavobacterium zepuense]TRW27241.1 iron dicitrate transport regulator FecR [Flavobacterium zepuense]